MNQPFGHVIKRAAFSVRRRGILGTMRQARSFFIARLPAARSEEALDRARDQQVDVLYRIDTAETIDAADLVTDSPNRAFSARYQPIRPEQFRAAMSLLPVPCDGMTFIDIGSGKGRALVLASEYPFERIIGVEFSPELHAISLANRTALNSASQKCSRIEPVCVDALEFDFPAEPTLLFLYSPFDARVMKPFVERVEASLRRHPRPMFVVYCNPVCAELWDQSSLLRRIAKVNENAVYTHI